jgi:hypothetical protein
MPSGSVHVGGVGKPENENPTKLKPRRVVDRDSSSEGVRFDYDHKVVYRLPRIGSGRCNVGPLLAWREYPTIA